MEFSDKIPTEEIIHLWIFLSTSSIKKKKKLINKTNKKEHIIVKSIHLLGIKPKITFNWILWILSPMSDTSGHFFISGCIHITYKYKCINYKLNMCFQLSTLIFDVENIFISFNSNWKRYFKTTIPSCFIFFF